jgi:hypothetical protein
MYLVHILPVLSFWLNHIHQVHLPVHLPHCPPHKHWCPR